MAVLLDTPFFPRRRRCWASAAQTRAVTKRTRANARAQPTYDAPAATDDHESLRPVWRILRTMQISGELCAEIDIAIDGEFTGVVRVENHALSTGAASRLEADVVARSVTVRGEIVGSIIASERVTLTKTACVRGTITAPRVELADGCVFLGTIVPGDEVDH